MENLVEQNISSVLLNTYNTWFNFTLSEKIATPEESSYICPVRDFLSECNKGLHDVPKECMAFSINTLYVAIPKPDNY